MRRRESLPRDEQAVLAVDELAGRVHVDALDLAHPTPNARTRVSVPETRTSGLAGGWNETRIGAAPLTLHSTQRQRRKQHSA
eukprot:1670939-Rhodomonas_salina.1